jgi:hypothetical protein
MNELKQFWEEQAVEIEKTGTDPQEFKNQQLPLARIKKVRHPPTHTHPHLSYTPPPPTPPSYPPSPSFISLVR